MFNLIRQFNMFTSQANTRLLLAQQIQSTEFTLTRIFIKLFYTGSPNTVNECQVSFGFLPAKYQIFIRTAKFSALLNFCRRLLRQKIVYVHCLLVMHASCMAYSCNSKKIFKLHVSCTMPFITKFL